jgi:hypothetical protein
LRHDAGGGSITVGCTYLSSDGLCDGHHGYWAIDFVGSTGSPVYAAGAGFATNATGSTYGGYGNVVVVDHGDRGKSLYAHLSEILVDGQWVDENTMIGRIGSSGDANTPHLHYEESGSMTFGSAGSRDPGPMKACRGSQPVTFPQEWSLSTWQGMPWGSGSVASDGTGCAVLGVVADALGPTVGNGVVPVKASEPTPGEQAAGADFNGDGVGDVGLRNIGTGLFVLRNGPSFDGQASYPWAPGANYQAFAGDFNGDRIGDIGLRDATSGMFFIKHGPTFADQVTYPWAAGSQFQVLATDFNADRMGDIGLRDTNTGVVTMKNGPTFESQATWQSPPGAEYQVVAADYNADRTGDIALRNTGTGVLTVNLGPTFAGQRSHPGKSGAEYQSFASDFNKDGTADLALVGPGASVAEISHGPAFADEISVPLVPPSDGLATLLSSLFGALVPH